MIHCTCTCIYMCVLMYTSNISLNCSPGCDSNTNCEKKLATVFNALPILIDTCNYKKMWHWWVWSHLEAKTRGGVSLCLVK